MVEPTQVDEFFPGWQSIEVFGPPGAGKSYFCRQLLQRRPLLLTTSDGQAMRHFLDAHKWPATRLANRLVSRRLMKNYDKFWLDYLSLRYWRRCGTNARRYLETVEHAIQQARFHIRSEKNFRKSVRYTGWILSLSYQTQQQVLVDEGLVRRFIDALAQPLASGPRSVLLDFLRICLAAYPWQKNALLIEAPTSLCIQRQHARGHVIHRPGKTQEVQQAAAETVIELCRQAGWKTLRIENADRPRVQTSNDAAA